MTVAELIAELQKLPQDKHVKVWAGHHDPHLEDACVNETSVEEGEDAEGNSIEVEYVTLN